MRHYSSVLVHPLPSGVYSISTSAVGEVVFHTLVYKGMVFLLVKGRAANDLVYLTHTGIQGLEFLAPLQWAFLLGTLGQGCTRFT